MVCSTVILHGLLIATASSSAQWLYVNQWEKKIYNHIKY